MGRALIVSAGASSNEYISARLAELGYPRPLIVPSGAEARRRILESDFELIVVNAPLPDEFGHELCADAVEKTDAGVLLLAKAAAAEQLLGTMSDAGVLLLSKPFSNTLFLHPVPPPLRHQLFDLGGHRQRVFVQRPAVVQHRAAGGVQAAAAPGGHGHQL